MKRSTALLGAIFLVFAAFAAVFLLGGTLSAEVSVLSAGAADYPQAFRSIQSILASDAAPQRFTAGIPANAEECRLEDVTITLSNRGLFDAEWVSVSVEGAPGDIAVYAITGEGGAVNARSVGTVNLKLIAGANGGGGRTYRVQYYTYGLKREIEVGQ